MTALSSAMPTINEARRFMTYLSRSSCFDAMIAGHFEEIAALTGRVELKPFEPSLITATLRYIAHDGELRTDSELQERSMNARLIAVILGILPGVLHAQSVKMPDVSIRAESEDFLRQYAETYRFSLGRPRSAQVTRDNSAVLFLRSQPRSFVQDLFEFDCQTGVERVLLTANQILQ